jgi:IS5 family transposase
MRRELKRPKIYLGRVYHDVAHKVAEDNGLALQCALLLGLTECLLTQERTSKNKLNSLHAPEVVCIAKGKAHRPYEFGSKVALAVTKREGFVPASKALEGKPYDGHTLSTTMDQIAAMMGVEPTRIYVDRAIAGTIMPRQIGCSSRASGGGSRPRSGASCDAGRRLSQ